jgi:hypothetical protein
MTLGDVDFDEGQGKRLSQLLSRPLRGRMTERGQGRLPHYHSYCGFLLITLITDAARRCSLGAYSISNLLIRLMLANVLKDVSDRTGCYRSQNAIL